MHRLLAAAAMAAAITLGGCANDPTQELPCTEDMACWNWTTMGDGQRGVITLSGNRAIVDCDGFARLNRAGRIDHDLTPALHGDAACIRPYNP